MAQPLITGYYISASKPTLISLFRKDKLTTIVARTVNLLRPYYSWKKEISKEEESIAEETTNSSNSIVKTDTEEVAELIKNLFSDLLMRKLTCASVVEKYSLNKECLNSGSIVEVLCGIFYLAEIAFLLVAR